MKLHAAYPNPFNGSTRISYDLNEAMNVKVSVFNTKRQQIDVLDSGERAAGTYNLTWNAKGLPTGLYLIKLNTPQRNEVRKVLLIR